MRKFRLWKGRPARQAQANDKGHVKLVPWSLVLNVFAKGCLYALQVNNKGVLRFRVTHTISEDTAVTGEEVLGPWAYSLAPLNHRRAFIPSDTAVEG